MADDVLAQIDELEHELTRLRHEQSVGTSGLAEQIGETQVRLDRLWDLRRRQQAAATAGQPEPHDLRSTDTVEHYRQ